MLKETLELLGLAKKQETNLEALQASVKALETQIAALDSKLVDSSARVAELTAKLTASEAETAKLNADLAASKAAQADFDAKVAEAASKRALEITAGQGQPPLAQTPSANPAAAKAPKQSNLTGLDRAIASYQETHGTK